MIRSIENKIPEKEKSMNFYNLWLKIISKFRKNFRSSTYIKNLMHLPHIMRDLTSTNSFENREWKISILITNNKKIKNLSIGKIKIDKEEIEKPIGIDLDREVNKIINNISKYLNIDMTFSTLESLARALKLDYFLKYTGIEDNFNAKFESIQKHLTLNSLNDKILKKYYFLLGHEGILNFSFDGTFIGTTFSSDTRTELIKRTRNSNSIGITVEGPFNRVIKYYIDGKYVLLDIYKDGKWLSIPSESIVKEISKSKPNNISIKAKYKLAEALSELIIKRRGGIIIISDQNKLKKDKSLLTVSNIQLFQNKYIEDIPFSSFVQLLNTDGAVIISKEGKLIFSGAMIAITSQFLIHSKTTGHGARHLVFKYLQYLKYNTLLLSEEGELYPNIIKVYSE